MVESRSDFILDPPDSRRARSPAGTSGVYEGENFATSTFRTPVATGGESISVAESMDGDARKDMPNPPKPDHTRPGARPRRSQSNPPRRLHSQSSQPIPGPAYPISSPRILETENAHQPPASFLPQPVHFTPAPSPYNQRSSFVGPYTMSPQQNPMNISHPQHNYAFPPAYHPSMVLENSMVPHNVHTNYQPMMQSLTPVFPYQRPSAEGVPPSHPSYSNTPSSSVYPSHPSSTPVTPHQPSSTSQGGSMSTPYGNSGTFHSLQYPPTMPMPAYRYQPQTYASSPMYQPPYSAPTFAQHFSPQGENEPQLAWYYFPQLASGPSPQAYNPGPSYQSHYAVGYSQAGHSGVDNNAYNPAGRTSTSNLAGPSSHYQLPSTSSSSWHHDSQRSADSPLLPSTAPLPQHGHSADEEQTAAPGESPGDAHRAASDRPLIRRSFHPNPPAHRSEWVMWVGNVPSDTTHDEIWRVFIAPADDKQGPSNNGVVSVFLISRSNCAFINYQSMEDLQQAIARFNGIPLRPNDSRCPRLVCRVRRTDDDLKAGVGYQRGMGMHTRWVRDQKLGETDELGRSPETSVPDGSPSPVAGSLARALSNVSLSSDEEGKKSIHPVHSGSSDSYSSTNSSFLARYFPQRYFILKSLSQEDLDISVARGVWATQKHNEEILDQAFRTSKDVFLIFGVNKSREFYGYARMAGPVIRGEHIVQWTTRPPHHTAAGSQGSLPILHESQPATFLSPTDQHLVDESPLPVDGSPSPRPLPGLADERHSAPALLEEEYHKPTLMTLPEKQQSLDQQRSFLKRGRRDQFALDTSAPGRAIRGNQDAPGRNEPHASTSALDLLHEEDGEVPEVEEETYDLTTPIVQPEEDIQRGEVSWGESFAVEWLSTARLSFNNTRHLRNPWNRDKEIKVSRDGTELEPSLGRQLLEDWHKPPELHTSPGGAPGKTPGGGRRPSGSKSGYPFPIVDGEPDGSAGDESAKAGLP